MNVQEAQTTLAQYTEKFSGWKTKLTKAGYESHAQNVDTKFLTFIQRVLESLNTTPETNSAIGEEIFGRTLSTSETITLTYPHVEQDQVLAWEPMWEDVSQFSVFCVGLLDIFPLPEKVKAVA